MELCAAWGMVLWFLGTAVMRAAGHLLLVPGRAWPTLLTFAVTLPAALAVTVPLYNRLGLEGHRRRTAASLVAMTAMLADACLVPWLRETFPQFSYRGHLLLMSWSLWAYVSLLVSGYVGAEARERVK